MATYIVAPTYIVVGDNSCQDLRHILSPKSIYCHRRQYVPISTISLRLMYLKTVSYFNSRKVQSKQLVISLRLSHNLINAKKVKLVRTYWPCQCYAANPWLTYSVPHITVTYYLQNLFRHPLYVNSLLTPFIDSIYM